MTTTHEKRGGLFAALDVLRFELPDETWDVFEPMLRDFGHTKSEVNRLVERAQSLHTAAQRHRAPKTIHGIEDLIRDLEDGVRSASARRIDDYWDHFLEHRTQNFEEQGSCSECGGEFLPGDLRHGPKDTICSGCYGGGMEENMRKRMGQRPIEKFFNAYVEAALYTSTDESTPSGGHPLDKNYDAGDFARSTLNQMMRDSVSFLKKHGRDIGTAYAQAGHDFWLTRNRHGAGFWDGDWPEPQATRLTKAAHAYHEYQLYVGDDDKIYAL